MKKLNTFFFGLTAMMIACFLFVHTVRGASGRMLPVPFAVGPIAQINADYDSLNFGSTFISQGQYPLYTYIYNTGNAPLILSAINSSPEFTTPEFLGPVTIEPLEEYALMINFFPSSVGLRSATLELMTNDPDHPVLYVYVEGLGFDPPVADTRLEGTSFLNQQSSKFLVVRNTTLEDYTYSIYFYFMDANYNDYTYETQLSLASGESAQIEIPVDGTGLPTGNYSGELYIDNLGDDWFRTFTIEVNWNILQAPTAGPDHHIVKTLLTGQTVSYDYVTYLSNPNDVPLAYTVTQSNPGSSFVGVSPSSGIIGAHQNVYFTLTFDTHNLSEGVHQQFFDIYIDDPKLQVVGLSITALVIENGPIITIPEYQTNYDFQGVWVGSGQYPFCINVGNAGSEPLIISEVRSTHPDFSADNLPPEGGLVIPPNSYEEYNTCISFWPSSVGLIEGEILIFSNDPIKPVLRIRLRGTGLASPFQPAMLTDTLFTNQQSAKTLTIENTTTDAYYFGFFAPEEFIHCAPSEVISSPGGINTVEITFDAHNLPPGEYSGIIYIQDQSQFHRGFHYPFRLYVISSIPDFSLTYFKSNREVSRFADLVTLDVADPDIEQYTIRANPALGRIGSVRFTLDGRTINTDNTEPYTINNWVLPGLSAGRHTLRVQAFSRDFGWGDAYEVTEVIIDVTNTAAVTQFVVADRNGISLGKLVDGAVINIGDPEWNGFNVLAVTNKSTIRSVKFELNGVTARIDNRAPYGISGTSSGYETPWVISPGTYTVKATPYMKYYGWGPAGIPMSVQFTITNIPSAGTNLALGQSEILTEERQTNINDQRLRVYPNPVQAELHVVVSSSEGSYQLQLVSIYGQVLYSVKGNATTSQEHTISMQQLGLQSGVYYLEFRDTSGFTEVIKILKQ